MWFSRCSCRVNQMLIENVNIFTEEKRFRAGRIRTEGTTIKSVTYADTDGQAGNGRECERVLDGGGCYAIPGMIDLHFHGCNGYDFCDGTEETLEGLAAYEASIGVTSVCPAAMTLPDARLTEILNCAADYRKKQMSGRTAHAAHLVGINMEGPFISRARRGAQDERYIQPCNVQAFRNFQRAAQGLIKFMGIAPEEGDADAFIRAVRDSVTVSLAHTDADYETAMRAFELGAGHVVHLYNAMSGFGHRAPGVVGAVFDSREVTAELICDGVHVHPAAVRMAFREIGAERLILISDSMRAAGLPDGCYTLGGQPVKVEGKKATLMSDGSLAGSVTTLPDCVRYCVREAHIPLEDAVACATANPARRLGIYDKCGSITAGKAADVVLLDRDLSLRAVILNGELAVGGRSGA